MAIYCILGLVSFSFAAQSVTAAEARAWLITMYLSFSAEGFLLVIALTEDTQGTQRRRTLSGGSSQYHLVETGRRSHAGTNCDG
jgi:hypothetical protein